MGAWIETPYITGQVRLDMSRPVWARGLKLNVVVGCIKVPQVAPRVGAWIETSATASPFPSEAGRAPCGRVD